MFTYDNGSRLARSLFGNGLTDTLIYDAASQLVRRQLYSGTYINDSVSYDPAGRVLRAKQSGATSTNSEVLTWYGPLGAVTAATGATVSATGTIVTEKFFNDALGNRDSTQQ